MPNTNCLEGFKCPKCGFEDSFEIEMKSTFTLTDDGTGDHGDTEWGDEAACQCGDCGHLGTVKDFRNVEPEGVLESEFDDDGTDYKLRDGAPSCWIAVGNIAVYILRTSEGVRVELLRNGDEENEAGALASCEA